MICTCEQCDGVFTILGHAYNRIFSVQAPSTINRVQPHIPSIDRASIHFRRQYARQATHHGWQQRTYSRPSPKTHRHMPRRNSFTRCQKVRHLIEIVDVDRNKIINRHLTILTDFTRCQNCHVQNICRCSNGRANLDGLINPR